MWTEGNAIVEKGISKWQICWCFLEKSNSENFPVPQYTNSKAIQNSMVCSWGEFFTKSFSIWSPLVGIVFLYAVKLTVHQSWRFFHAAAMQEEAKLATPLYPMALFPAIAVVHHSDDSATSISLHNDEGQAPVIIHQSQLTVTGLTGDGQQETGSNTGFTELTAATLTTSMRSSSGGRVSTSTGPMEETFLTNEDLSEEDRNKAIVWAAAVQGAEHVGFLPECVLKTGFKIKKYKLWMPLEVCVDYTHKRLTLLFPDSVSVGQGHHKKWWFCWSGFFNAIC